MEFAYLEGLAEAEVVDVDYHAFGYLGVGSLYFELLHRELELTTGFHTFGVAFELHGYFNYHRLVFANLEEVDVEYGVLYGVELYFAEHCIALLTVYFEFDSEYVGSIEELAHVVVLYYDIGSDDAFAVADLHELFTGLESCGIGEGNDFAAIEDSGDEALGAEGLGSLLAEVGTGLCRKIVSLHFVGIKNCVTQN